MFDRSPDDAKRVMSRAREVALQFGHEYIGTEHILVGLCEVEGSVAWEALRELGVDPTSVRPEVEPLVEKGKGTSMGQLPFTPGGKRVLERSMEVASALGYHYIGTEHLLLGLIAEGKGIGARVLGKLGVEPEGARDAVTRIRPPGGSLSEPLRSREVARALQEARAEARRRGHGEFDVPHLLLALLQRHDGFVADWLAEEGLDRDGLREKLRRTLDDTDRKT